MAKAKAKQIGEIGFDAHCYRTVKLSYLSVNRIFKFLVAKKIEGSDDPDKVRAEKRLTDLILGCY